MSEQPSRGVPDWLAVDITVIIVSLAIVGAVIWIAP